MAAHRLTLLVIEFPNGDFEYRTTTTGLPQIGATFRSRGTTWRVRTIAPSGTIMAEQAPAEGQDPAGGSPDRDSLTSDGEGR